MSDVERSDKGERTRAEILEAAAVRFGRDGFQATSVADIARDVGVARSAPYAYFENKDDLFFQALDHDAAATIADCLPVVFADPDDEEDWVQHLMLSLAVTIEAHPLARRVLGGLEPAITARALEMQAILDLRAAVTERMRGEQEKGEIRPDIDIDAVASAIVTVMLSLLMATVQLGPGLLDAVRLSDINALVDAALHAPVHTAGD